VFATDDASRQSGQERDAVPHAGHLRGMCVCVSVCVCDVVSIPSRLQRNWTMGGEPRNQRKKRIQTSLSTFPPYRRKNGLCGTREKKKQQLRINPAFLTPRPPPAEKQIKKKTWPWKSNHLQKQEKRTHRYKLARLGSYVERLGAGRPCPHRKSRIFHCCHFFLGL